MLSLLQVCKKQSQRIHCSKELPQLYRSADCFVTMSLSETFGLTCLEAEVEFV